MILSLPQDKYRYDSERAELPSRPVDLELGYNPASGVANNSNHHQKRSHSSLQSYASFDRPLGANANREANNPTHTVKRDAIVKSVNLQPSVYINGKFHNPWPNYKMPTFTNILKLGFSHDKSNIPSKQVRLRCRSTEFRDH